jgi:hypothetical protein
MLNQVVYIVTAGLYSLERSPYFEVRPGLSECVHIKRVEVRTAVEIGDVTPCRFMDRCSVFSGGTL